MISEKCEYERHVQLLEMQVGRSGPKLLGRERKQELKSVGLGIAGVRAGAAFVWQPIAQKGCKVWRERSH